MAALAAVVIVVAQLFLLPSISSDAHTRLRDLGQVLKTPFALVGIIATAVAFIGQFGASTFITPLLIEHVHMGEGGAVTALLFAYGASGIVGTLVGGPLVARSRVATFALAASGVGVALIALPTLGTSKVAVGVAVVAWGLIWGVIPLTAQVWMLRAMPDAQEAASAVNVSNLQISIAIGSAVGGLLVDNAGLVPVYLVGGAIVIVSALFASIAGRRAQRALTTPSPQV